MRAWAAIVVMLLACGQTVANDHTPGVTLVSDEFGCDCFPIYPPDPTSATITLEYRAGAQATAFHVVEVRWVFSSKGGSTGVLVSHVTPEGSGLLTPGQDLVVDHVKLEGTGSAPCYFDTQALEVDVSGPLGTVTLKRDAQPLFCPE